LALEAAFRGGKRNVSTGSELAPKTQALELHACRLSATIARTIARIQALEPRKGPPNQADLHIWRSTGRGGLDRRASIRSHKELLP